MAVKVFCGEEFSEHEREWNQFKEVFNLINEKYANTDELVYVLSNFYVSGTQIDVLILREKGIAILDLKSYEGKIIGSENGAWRVIDKNGNEIPLKKNLFRQLQSQKFALLEKLNLLRQKGNFENIEEDKLARIKCWGYFEKGSTYDINQVGSGVHIWFDVITADKLIEKMGFLNAGYVLRQEDMDAIVKGLNLKEYSFEKRPQRSDYDIFESNYRRELNVFIPPNNWDEIISKIMNSNIVTIVGEPRVGKTTAIINIAKELKKSGYEIKENKELLMKLFHSRDENDQKEFFNLIKNKNVFILDDLFGSNQYDPSPGNAWVPFLIRILESAIISSKFIIGSRIDVMDEFLYSNKGLNYCNLVNEFKNSIFDLKFSCYTDNKQKEIFDKNMNFIQLKESNKTSILYNNIDKILRELVLPGEIWHFLENVRDNELQESDIDKFIDKSKRKVHFTKEEIKLLKSYEKFFLYNLYINQNFIKDDLEAIYSSCLTSDMQERNYFMKCVAKFEDYFIKTKNENLDFEIFIKDMGKNRFEFAHPIYREAIEKLINSDKDERCNFEDILNKVYNSIHHKSIMGWKSNDFKYNKLKFNIYQIILTHYTNLNEPVKDFIIEILNELDFKEVWPLWSDSLELSINNKMHYYHEANYLEKLFYNYNKFDEVLKNTFIHLLENVDNYEVVAYCFAYMLDPETVIKFQDKLKELSNGNEKVKHLVAKCIIKNYNFIKENNKKVLLSMGIKTTVMQYLIHNYDLISNELKEILSKQIQSAAKNQLIETGESFLINYNFLPEKIKQKYEFIFDLKNGLAIKQVGGAFRIWFSEAFSDLEYNEKREIPDKKVLDLYCDYLKDEKIVLENFKEMVDFYEWADFGTLGYSILHYPNKEDFSNKINPKWNNPFYSELRKSLETNMTILLGSIKTQIGREYVYSDAFFFYSFSGNMDLLNKIKNILNEDNDTKFKFLDIIEADLDLNEKDSNNPFKLTNSQIYIIEKLSEPKNHPEIRAKAKELLNYIHKLKENKIILIIPDDYS